MPRRALPPALKALESSLAKATEPALKERLVAAIAGVRRLYKLPDVPPEDTGDMKRLKGLRPTQYRSISPGAMAGASRYRQDWRQRLQRGKP
jgi:hypothetical protein